MNNIPFLPLTIKRENDKTINEFIDDIFEILMNHFYIQKIRFNKSIVRINDQILVCAPEDNCNSGEYNCSSCPFEHKLERFNHIITGKNETSRTPGKYNENRASRINWIKPIIENVSHEKILYFNKPYKSDLRHYFWAKEDDYIVIVNEGRKSRLYIVTAFIVDDPTYYKRYEKEYNDYINSLPHT